MYTFKVYHNGSLIDGTPVFPLRWQDLLDERLDECYIDLIASGTAVFPITDDVTIEIYENGERVDEKYYIIARDDARRYPTWGTTYTHTLFLLERTKLLEGIICPNLTFTNAFGIVQDSWVLANSTLAAPYNGYIQPLHGVYYGRKFELPSIEDIFTYKGNNILTSPSPNGLGFYRIIITENTRLQIDYGNGESQSCAISSTTSKVNIERSKGYNSRHATFSYIVHTQAVNSDSSQTLEVVVEYKDVALADYPPPRITITDVVDRILRCAEPLTKDDEPRYRLADDDAERFSKIYAPEFSMTQCTLREQLKVVGSFVHAEPWLDGGNVIHYKDYGEQTASPLAGKAYISEGGSHDINEYHTALHSTSQNVTSSINADASDFSPSSKLYQNLRANTKYVRLTDENGVLVLPSPILSVKKVMCGLSNGDNEWWIKPKDITKYVYESTEYSANLWDFDSNTIYTKAYALYYTIGSDTIDGFFYRSAEPRVTQERFAITNILSAVSIMPKEDIQDIVSKYPQNLVLQVEYIPLTDVTVQHGKQGYLPGRHPFMKQYNQGENMVECQWLGENIKGAAARLGNPEQERTYILDGYDEIPETGQALDGYAISSVATEVCPYYLKCTVGLTKDFNRLSEYIGVSSVKRLYEISERQTYLRDIVIHNTLVIGALPGEPYTADTKRAFVKLDGVKDALQSGTNNNIVRTVSVKTFDSDGLKMADLVLPVYAKALGNAVSLSFGFSDNFSAGSWLRYKEGEDDVKGYWEADAPYTDYFGKVKVCKIEMHPDADIKFDPNSNDAVNQAIHLPNRWEYSTSFDSSAVSFEHLLDKDNREIPRYNFVLEAKTNDDNITVGSGIALMNSMVYDYSNKPRGNVSAYVTTAPISRFTQRIDTRNSAFTYISDITVTEYGNGYLQIDPHYIDYSLPMSDSGIYYVIVAHASFTEERTVSGDDGVPTTETIISGGEVLFTKKVTVPADYSELQVKSAIEKALEEICFYITSE